MFDINVMEMSKARPVPFDKTLQVRDSCLCLHLQRAARAVARHFDDALRPPGLTSGQFSLLMSLNRPEPPTIGMVAAMLAMDRTTLTAALKPLQRRGCRGGRRSGGSPQPAAEPDAGRHGAARAGGADLGEDAGDVEQAIGDPEQLRTGLRALA